MLENRRTQRTMDALTRALSDADRSYQLAKASSATLRNQMIAQGPNGNLVQRNDFFRSTAHLDYFRGWVYASIRPIAQKIAGQTVKVGRKVAMAKRAKSKVDFEEIEAHPLAEKLCNPNSLMTGWALMFTTVATLELAGKQLWWFCEDGDHTDIYPIPPNWIVEITGTTRREVFHVRPPRYAGEPIPIPAKQAVYFSYPNPADPHGSWSPLQATGLAVKTDEALQKSQLVTFEEGFKPKHALIVGETKDSSGVGYRPQLTSPQRRQLIASLKKLYSGFTKNGEPLILDGMIEDVKKLSNNPDEMDFLDSGKTTKERICQIFGTNPVIMGQLEGANRASSFAAKEHFAEFTCNPKIELLNQTLTTTLGPRYAKKNENLVVWMEPIVPADAEMELKKYELAARSSVVTVNEFRSWMELAPVDWGDVPIGMANTLDDEIRRLVGAE